MTPVSGDFSRGRVSLIILRLGLPMMLAEFVHVLYNIVDRMYIGHMAEGGTLALNYPRYALFFSLLRKIVLVAPLTLLLPNIGLGVYGVFWAELDSQVIGATACFMTMVHVIWKKMKIKDREEMRNDHC